VFGYYDHNLLGAYERCVPFGASPDAGAPAGRLWRIRARRVVLATGAFERPFAFGGNDLPGVMLASAVRSYLARWAVAPGRRAVIATNNDDAYRTALALHAAGVEIAAVCDSRPDGGGALGDAARARGIPILTGSVLRRAHGGRAVEGAEIQRPGGGRIMVDADLIAVSGGWNPAVHLFCQSGGRLVFDPARATFLPGTSVQAERSAGAAAGGFGCDTALAQGAAAGAWASGDTTPRLAAPRAPEVAEAPLAPLWEVRGGGKAWVDLLSDVTSDDVRLAARENYVSVEHLKRYTTLGMATDQGKTSNVVGLALLAPRDATSRRSARRASVRPSIPCRSGPWRGASAAISTGRARVCRCMIATSRRARRSRISAAGSDRPPICAPARIWRPPLGARRRMSAPRSASSTARRWARSWSRGRMRRHSSTGSMPAPCRRWRRGGFATGSC
jgi:sarcosine oxidase subunit alpha